MVSTGGKGDLRWVRAVSDHTLMLASPATLTSDAISRPNTAVGQLTFNSPGRSASHIFLKSVIFILVALASVYQP